MTQYNISYQRNNVYQTILVNAQSDAAAVAYFQQYKPGADIIGCDVATRDDQRPGKPVLTVPEDFQPAQEETPAQQPETAAVLESVIKDAMQLCYDSTSMALDIICERLFYDHGINATFSGRSVYIGDRRAASIKTCVEPCDDCKIICIYDYTIII